MNAIRKRLSDAIETVKLKGLIYSLRAKQQYLLLGKRWTEVKLRYHEWRLQQLQRAELLYESRDFQEGGDE